LRTLRRSQQENAAKNECRDKKDKKDKKVQGFHRVSSLMVRRFALGETGLVISFFGTEIKPWYAN